MEFKDVVESRRSIRRFRPEQVPQKELEAVLSAVRLAPSWRNLQGWQLHVVAGAAKARLAAAVPETNRGRTGLDQAPLVVALVADPGQSGRRGTKEFYLFDTGLALAHLALAARERGLATCCIGWFDEDAARSALGLPTHLQVVVITPLGYPAEVPTAPGA